MTNDEFQTASLGQLAIVTGLDRHRWSRYLADKVAITDKTLTKIAPTLDMTPSQLLSAILERREKVLSISSK